MARRLDDGNPMLNAALIAVAVALYLGFCLLVQAAAATAVHWDCHTSTPWTFSPAAGIGLFAGRMNWIIAEPTSCGAGTGSVWMLIGPALAGLVVLIAVGVLPGGEQVSWAGRSRASGSTQTPSTARQTNAQPRVQSAADGRLIYGIRVCGSLRTSRLRKSI